MKKALLALLLFSVYTTYAQEHLSASRSNMDPLLAPFYHGVASGDPLTDRIILWTRVTTEDATVSVDWQIATDTAFTNVVNSGNVTADSSTDYCVKVDATGLQANTWYYYRFKAYGAWSSIGRTRTAPDSHVNNLRFAVVACSNYQDGFFNAYRDIAKKNDVDAVIHLGDYYYEYGTDDFTPGVDSARLHEPPTEILTLADYRMRHSQYKLDPDLRYVHQMYPFITIWDDHETANDSWSGGAQNHTDSVEGYWKDRESYAHKAYFEWMPIRNVHNSVDTIHRVIPLGGLADLILVDTRNEGRDKQIGTTGAAVTDTNRTMMGAAQLEWFKQQLSASTAKWKLIGNQVMMSPLKVLGQAVNQDQWDGYPAERAKIFNYIASNNINNVVVLTGDIHTSWANDLPLDPSSYNSSTGAGSIAVEYVCTSITSGSFITFAVPVSAIQLFNPNVKYGELSKRGYLLLDVTDQKVQGDWLHMSTITSKTFTANVAASWCDMDAANHLTTCGGPIVPRTNMPPQPPFIESPATGIKQENMVIVGCYPNPFDNKIQVQYYLYQPATVQLQITDLNGRIVYSERTTQTVHGLYNAEANVSNLTPGTYFVTVNAGGKSYSKQVVKVR
ncbi:MAG: alkaline phosphatase D family protein [Chitinophagales bacterium]